jgi:hypothetical protein
MRLHLSAAIYHLDALAERDNQPRLFVYPADADGHWMFTDTHVLFRFPVTETGIPIDLSRWLRVEPARGRHGVLDGADRQGDRFGRTGKVWRSLAGDLGDSETSRWGEEGLDTITFRPASGADVAINARLFRVALIPARADEVVLCDVVPDAPIWLHGRDWSAAVAPLRHVGKVRSDRLILQID